jgi:sugar transferase EpsL
MLLFPTGVPHSKRILDLTLTVPGMIVLLPVMGLVALCVRVFLGQPVLFRQMRPGYRAELFPVYKFRTMTDSTRRVGKASTG